MVRNFILSTAVATSAIASIALGNSSATAETATYSMPMHVATAVRVVGERSVDGTVPVLLTDGTTFSIAQDKVGMMLRASRDMVRSNSVVTCGTTRIALHEKSNGLPVKMTTGFTIYSNLPAAVYYNWNARIQGFKGSGYGYDYHADGGLLYRHSWNGQHTSDKSYPRGFYGAWITLAGAVLSDGTVCISGPAWTLALL